MLNFDLDSFKSGLENELNDDELLKKFYQKAEKSGVDYSDTTPLAVMVGRKCSKYINSFDWESIDVADLKEFAEKIIASAYNIGQAHMNDICQTVQANLNQAAGLQIKPVNVAIDTSRIENIVNRFAETEKPEKVKFLTEDGVSENIMRSQVIDNIRANAEFDSDAGIPNLLIRHLGNSGCCKWCQSMAGEYEYGQQPEDFWRVHKSCDCWIEYKVGKTKSQIRFQTSGGKISKITS